LSLARSVKCGSYVTLTQSPFLWMYFYELIHLGLYFGDASKTWWILHPFPIFAPILFHKWHSKKPADYVVFVNCLIGLLLTAFREGCSDMILSVYVPWK